MTESSNEPGGDSHGPSMRRVSDTLEATPTRVDPVRASAGNRNTPTTTNVPQFSNEGEPCPTRGRGAHGLGAATTRVDERGDSDIIAGRPGHGYGSGRVWGGATPAAAALGPAGIRTASDGHGEGFSEHTGGAAPRFTRSISSRSRRTISTSSIRPLVPAVRGLERQSLTPRTSSARTLSGGVRRSSASSPSTPVSDRFADAYARVDSSRDSSSSQQQQQEQPQPQQQQEQLLTDYSFRVPARQGRPDCGRARVRRLSGGGRGSWRSPAVAYNAVERRMGLDTTALRAVSARLDAASTAIDAVEIGVRSASDSLDCLLQLLQSQRTPLVSPSYLSPTTAESVAVVNRHADRGPSPSRVVGRERVGTASGVRASANTMSPPAVSLSAVPGSMMETSSGESSVDDITVSALPPTDRLGRADRQRGPMVFDRGTEGGGRLRAASMLGREPQAGSTTVSHPEAGEYRRWSTAVTPRQIGDAQENAAAARDISIGETKEELRTPTSLDEISISALAIPRPPSSRTVQEAVDKVINSRNSEEREIRGRHGVSISARSARHGFAAEESAPASGQDPPTSDGGRGTMQAATPGSSQEIGIRRASSRGTTEIDSTDAPPTNDVNTAVNPDGGDLYFPVVELETVMNGIDTERGRLILEIARLRGQQNQSLVHLQRLQHEQFVVRQRQVSTLSEIVNSFGRTVAAAGALPHGEDSSLGRISSDVVSTLRRMLRLLSSTVPAATAADPTLGNPSVLATTLAPGGTLPSSSDAPDLAAARERSAAIGSAGPHSAGGSPTLDLTQEVIDAALQALPRLAAAATAISGARRMQGYLGGDGAGAAEGRPRDAGRCCTKETIAALPDAPPVTGGPVGEGGGDGVRGCVICLSEDSTAGHLLCCLPCDHVFHRACVGKWLMMQDSCPTCRRQVPNIEISSTPAATTAPREVV